MGRTRIVGYDMGINSDGKKVILEDNPVVFGNIIISEDVIVKDNLDGVTKDYSVGKRRTVELPFNESQLARDIISRRMGVAA